MFKDNLKSLRLNKRMTQDELGKIIHVSGKTIGAWERGTRQPNIETINKLSDFFNVSTDELLDNSKNNLKNNDLKLTPTEALKHTYSADGKPVPLEDIETLAKIIEQTIRANNA